MRRLLVFLLTIAITLGLVDLWLLRNYLTPEIVVLPTLYQIPTLEPLPSFTPSRTPTATMTPTITYHRRSPPAPLLPRQPRCQNMSSVFMP